ncbi:3-dehydroquinate synthase II [Candidatus Gracilibacteria bacterium]|nr:3-dehydroquinate synthase II [Candidatus Gracilibacteria bacterium]MCF7856759.1 3-dehydroquinate synthase II [Candidatus Gracilibacteria bacterium]MCF7897059.1 3-dehydroquinate synthase II [Candidatus Gracilibacteria bacterium]
MKKLFWVSIPKWNKGLVTTAIESGADALVLPKGFSKKAKELGLIQTVASDGDLKLGKDVCEFTITSKEVEGEVVAAGEKVWKIIRNKDWSIIPLENLISKTKNIIQTVADSKKALLALTTMEVGSDGILLETPKAAEIVATGKVVREANNEKLQLVRATIESTEAVGVADRVCVDTAAILAPGQGILAGDSSSAMFLVFNENVQSPYCDPRPFRVNVGAVHAYVRLPDNKTGYLNEVRSGSQILIVDQRGNTFPLAVGRAKIEKRPMLLVRGKIPSTSSGQVAKTISLVMQNAETIRLTIPNGKPISITKLKKGDEVLAFTEDAGRHFGVKVKETITER